MRIIIIAVAVLGLLLGLGLVAAQDSEPVHFSKEAGTYICTGNMAPQDCEALP